MKITIEIPEPKFKIGQQVELTTDPEERGTILSRSIGFNVEVDENLSIKPRFTTDFCYFIDWDSDEIHPSIPETFLKETNNEN